MRSVLFIIAVLIAAPAHALSIRNLSDTTKVVVITQGGQHQEVILPPKATRHFYGGGMTLSMPGKHPIRADFTDEYAIWPDGTLSIQRRNTVRGRVR